MQVPPEFKGINIPSVSEGILHHYRYIAKIFPVFVSRCYAYCENFQFQKFLVDNSCKHHFAVAKGFQNNRFFLDKITIVALGECGNDLNFLRCITGIIDLSGYAQRIPNPFDELLGFIGY